MTTARSDLRTIWYMGSKTRLCPEFIEGAVADLLPEGDTLLDLCTGTAAVARTFAPRHRIFANDVQRFSTVIAQAHLVGDARWHHALEHLEPETDLARVCHNNRSVLEKLLPVALEREKALLPRVIEELSQGCKETPTATEYREFVSATPEPVDSSSDSLRSSPDSRYEPFARGLAGLLRERRRNPRTQPYALITAYAGNVYFGLTQSIAIDSFRAAIDSIPDSDRWAQQKRALYLAALIQAVSVSTSGTSHFAQPRSIAKDRELLAVARRRSIDIEKEFYIALDSIRREWGHNPRREGNRVFNCSAEELLAAEGPLSGEEIGLVYLDPPYTADNYSRFYHLLETLVEYDYPELATRGGELTRGRYPVSTKRFHSQFCSRDGVESAFRTMIDASYRLGANLLISYAAEQGLLMKCLSDRGIEEPVRRFREICLETYPRVEIRERELMHSGQGDSNRAARELLVLCER